MGYRIRRRARQLSWISFALFWAQFAAAEAFYTKDRSANEVIGQAIDEHYFVMDFEQAEHVLLAVVRACGDKCRPQTLARAWMYVGIVRANGKQQLDGAGEAFEKARAHDPSVHLDLDLANGRTRALWEETSAPSAASGTPQPELPAQSHASERRDSPRDWRCRPEPLLAQLGYRLPIRCRAPIAVRSVTLHYMEFGEDRWQRLTLSRQGERFEGLLPCSATAYAGPLKFFLTFETNTGTSQNALGSRATPQIVTVDPDSRVIHALSDGSSAPRCDNKPLCPPGFPCASRGQACASDADCKQGLSCSAPGDLADGTCQLARPEKTPPALRHRFGVQAALDVVSLPGQTGLCSSERQGTAQRDYDCYLGNTPYPDSVGAPVTGGAGKLEGGLAPGTWRLLAHYETSVAGPYALGARGGVALSALPESLVFAHAELQVKRYLAEYQALFKPFVVLAAGLGRNAASKRLMVSDQNRTSGEVTRLRVKAVAVSDPYFAALGLGAEFELMHHLRLIARVDLLLNLPEARPGLRPALGVVSGF